MMLRLIEPGKRRPTPFYIARGRINGRLYEVSTGTSDPDEAARRRDAFAEQLASATPPRIVHRSALDRLVMPINEILRLPAHGERGIYFLFDNAKLIYVGQSHRMRHRIKRHREERRISFTTYRILECDMDEMDVLEALYVFVHRPQHNKGVNRNRRALRLAKTVGKPGPDFARP